MATLSAVLVSSDPRRPELSVQWEAEAPGPLCPVEKVLVTWQAQEDVQTGLGEWIDGYFLLCGSIYLLIEA